VSGVKRFVAEITLTTDDSGGTTTFYLATTGFCTSSADTPSDAYIPSRLISAGVFSRSLFAGGRVTGAVKPNFGDLLIANDDGAYDDWLGYGVAGGQVIVRWGDESAAYPAGYSTVYVAYVHSLKADMNQEFGSSIQLRMRSRDYLLDRPILTASFAGTGGLEGSSALAGKLKQFVSSDPGYIPVTLINAALQLYFVQSTGTGGAAASFKCYQGGVETTRGADYTSDSDCLTNAPAAGQCRFWFGAGGNGPVYLRLAAAPQYDLRVYALGYQSGGGAWSFTALAAVAGISGGSGSGMLSAQMVDDPTVTYAQVMSDACGASFGYFGMTRLDAFVAATFDVPGVTAAATWDIHSAWRWQRNPPPDCDVPVARVSVQAGRTWPAQVQAGASDTMKDYLQRTPVWSAFTASSASTALANPGAQAFQVQLNGRHFQSQVDQSTFAAGFFARFGVRRDYWTLAVQMSDANLAVELCDTVQIKLPRYGLDAGKFMRVISQQIDCDRREITFGVWG